MTAPVLFAVGLAGLVVAAWWGVGDTAAAGVLAVVSVVWLVLVAVGVRKGGS